MPKDEACKALEEFIALLLRERDVPQATTFVLREKSPENSQIARNLSPSNTLHLRGGGSGLHSKDA